MILFPPAKINLGLNVLNKRVDGFHNIETCVYQLPFHDVLEILPSKQLNLKITGLSMDCAVESNLVMKAYRLMQAEFSLPNVFLHLRKNIPFGSGLGGGSSDATYTLIALNRLFDLGLSNEQLKSFAALLGSDCPLFVEKCPQIASGRGDELSDVDLKLKGYYLKLVFPDVHVSTEHAYKRIEMKETHNSVKPIIQSPISNWRENLKNDFEQGIFKMHPSMKQIKNELYKNGALYTSMTGSGSCLYGIFDKLPETSPIYRKERVFAL